MASASKQIRVPDHDLMQSKEFDVIRIKRGSEHSLTYTGVISTFSAEGVGSGGDIVAARLPGRVGG
jgi:hypothetical protein